MLTCHGYCCSGCFFFSRLIPMFSLFFPKHHIMLFHFLNPFCSIHSLFYLYCIFYFLPLFAVFLFPSLTISPPSTLSKLFFISLVNSYYFFLSYKILILFPPLLIFAHLLLMMWLWFQGVFAGMGFVSWVVLFCSGSTSVRAYKMWCGL